MSPKHTAPNEERIDDLGSLVSGLYTELDKLSKKQPIAPLSDYAMKKVNLALTEARELLGPYDRYARELGPFVAAGTNPEVQDALLAMREIKQALSRVRNREGLDFSEAFD
jgi:hypothetical protein